MNDETSKEPSPLVGTVWIDGKSVCVRSYAVEADGAEVLDCASQTVWMVRLEVE